MAIQRGNISDIQFKHGSTEASSQDYKYITELIRKVMKDSQGQMSQEYSQRGHFRHSVAFNPTDRKARYDHMLQEFNLEIQKRFGEDIDAVYKNLEKSMQGLRLEGGMINPFAKIGSAGTGFERIKFNPLMGGVQRHIERQFAAQGIKKGRGYSITGEGTEKRIEAVVSSQMKTEIEKVLGRAQEQITKGTYDYKPMESHFIPQHEFESFKTRFEALRYHRKTQSLSHPGVRDAYDNVVAKVQMQQRQKELTAQAKDELGITSGGEGSRGAVSSGQSIGRGILGFLSAGYTIWGVMKNAVVSMYGVLKKISYDLGKVVMDAAALGIDPEKADRYRRAAMGNPVHTGGDNMLYLDAMKVMQTKFGNWVALEGNFNPETTAVHGLLSANVVQSVISAAKNRNFEKSFDLLLSDFMSAHKDGIDEELLSKQWEALSIDFDPKTAHAFVALLRESSDKGYLNDKAFLANPLAYRTDPSRVDTLSMGVKAATFFGSFSDVGFKNLSNANAVMGDVEQLKNAFYMKFIENIDTIIGILFSIAKGLTYIIDTKRGDKNLTNYNRVVAAEESWSDQALRFGEQNAVRLRKARQAYIAEEGISKGKKDNKLKEYVKAKEAEITEAAATGVITESLKGDIGEDTTGKLAKSLLVARLLAEGEKEGGWIGQLREAQVGGDFIGAPNISKLFNNHFNELNKFWTDNNLPGRPDEIIDNDFIKKIIGMAVPEADEAAINKLVEGGAAEREKEKEKEKERKKLGYNIWGQESDPDYDLYAAGVAQRREEEAARKEAFFKARESFPVSLGLPEKESSSWRLASPMLSMLSNYDPLRNMSEAQMQSEAEKRRKEEENIVEVVIRLYKEDQLIETITQKVGALTNDVIRRASEIFVGRR